MPNSYKKVELPELWKWAYHGEFNGIKTETKLNCQRPSRNRKYIKILALCMVYAPAKLIYPNTKQPLMHEVRDLCRLGYLDRYSRAGDRKYYYKTTRKGIELLTQVLES